MIVSLASLVIFVLDILAIVDCAKSSMDSGKKVLWIVLICVVSALGVVALKSARNVGQ